MVAPGIEPVLEHQGIAGPMFDMLSGERVDLPTAAGTAQRGSESLHCVRAVALRVMGAVPDFEIGGKSLAAFEVGTIWHEVIQRVLRDSYGAELEVTVDLRPRWDCSLHADAVYEADTGALRVVEIKSKAEYAYKLFALGTKKPFPREADYGAEPMGPEAADLVQAGKSAIGIGADEVHILYANKNKSHEITEWIIGVDDPIPYLDGQTITDLAVADLNLQTGALADLEAGFLPVRFQPEPDPRSWKKDWEGGVIHNPPQHFQVTGRWGTPFRCSGCAFNLTCRRLPADAVPLEIAGIKTTKESNDG
jgi:hypothetical protein